MQGFGMLISFIVLNPMVMKTAIRKSYVIIYLIKLVVRLLVETLESPQTTQFRRLKRFIAE